MEEEEMQDLIKENIRLTRENNRLLRKLWRAELWSFWSKLLITLVMIGVPVLIYRYYLADVMQDLWYSYDQVLQGVEKIEQLPEQLPISAVLESVEQGRQRLFD
ncbi:MAG: hypothetical protein KBD21_01445 [Candidatus Pacebacteria bacterium]|nr:hypothetical protein [Candidatus Paceibacterota bacterium]